MPFFRDKLAYLRELVILVIAVIVAITGIITWFSYKAYNIEKDRLRNSLKMEFQNISRSFTDNIDHTEAVMKMIATQIKANSDDLDYVNGILSKYRPNPNVVEALTWTISSWANANHFITVDAVYGILDQPINLSNRDYIPLTKSDPGIVHLGKPVYLH